VAIPLTSESARPPAALIDGDQMSIVELLERDPRLVALVREAEDAELAAGGGRKGKGPSTTAPPAATASSFTGNLRAARCVARRAGSMLSGVPSRSCPTTSASSRPSGTRSRRREIAASSSRCRRRRRQMSLAQGMTVR